MRYLLLHWQRFFIIYIFSLHFTVIHCAYGVRTKRSLAHLRTRTYTQVYTHAHSYTSVGYDIVCLVVWTERNEVMQRDTESKLLVYVMWWSVALVGASRHTGTALVCACFVWMCGKHWICTHLLFVRFLPSVVFLFLI